MLNRTARDFTAFVWAARHDCAVRFHGESLLESATANTHQDGRESCARGILAGEGGSLQSITQRLCREEDFRRQVASVLRASCHSKAVPRRNCASEGGAQRPCREGDLRAKVVPVLRASEHSTAEPRGHLARNGNVAKETLEHGSPMCCEREITQRLCC
jgi:hypothetical protein